MGHGVSTVTGAPIYEALKDALAAFESDPSIEAGDQNFLVIFPTVKFPTHRRS